LAVRRKAHGTRACRARPSRSTTTYTRGHGTRTTLPTKTTTPEDVAVAGTDQDQSRAFARSVSTLIACCKQEEAFHRDASKEDHDAGGDTAAELSPGKPTPPPLREERGRGPSSDREETRRVNAAKPTADARGGQRPTRPSRAQDPDLEAENHIEQARQVHCGADERAPRKKIRGGEQQQ
jgi:hypothetical protein